MESEEERRTRKEREGGVCRERRGRGRLEDKERQTERGGVVRREKSCSPEGSLLVSHSTGPSNV